MLLSIKNMRSQETYKLIEETKKEQKEASYK